MLLGSLSHQLHITLKNGCSFQEVPPGWFYITQVFAALVFPMYLGKQSSACFHAFVHHLIPDCRNWACTSILAIIFYNFKIHPPQSHISAMPFAQSLYKTVKVQLNKVITSECETHFNYLSVQCN